MPEKKAGGLTLPRRFSFMRINWGEDKNEEFRKEPEVSPDPPYAEITTLRPHSSYDLSRDQNGWVARSVSLQFAHEAPSQGLFSPQHSHTFARDPNRFSNRVLRSIPELYTLPGDFQKWSCLCENCAREPGRKESSVDQNVFNFDDGLSAPDSYSAGQVVYRRQPQSDTIGRNRSFWGQKRNQRNRRAMSTADETTASMSSHHPEQQMVGGFSRGSHNRPPNIPMRPIFRSTEMLLNSPVPMSPPGGRSEPVSPFINNPLSPNSPSLSHPSQSQRGGKRLKEFKQSFLQTWGKTSKKQPSFQHQVGSPFPANSEGGYGFDGGLGSSYGSGVANIRSGNSSQTSINRLNLRDSASFPSDGERFSFCSSMSDDALSDAKLQSIDASSAAGFAIPPTHVSTPPAPPPPPRTPQITLPCTMMAVSDYEAIKEDQISVKAGDTIQVLSVSKSMYYVFREGNGDTIQDSEGYVPDFVVNPPAPDLNRSEDSLRSPSVYSVGPSFNANSLLTALPANQRSSWHSTTISNKFFDQSAMSRQSRDPITNGTATTTRKSKSTASLAKNAGNNLNESGGGTSLFNTFRRRNRSSSKSSTVSRRVISSGSDMSTDGRPGEPGKPEILKKSRTSVEIGWAIPEYTGNQIITGYTIELSRKGSNLFAPYGSLVKDTCALIEDLIPGASYQFRVSALNQSGVSLPSEASDPVTISATENNNKNRSIESLGKVSWSSKFDDHYIKSEELSRGRFSSVWKCEHKKSKKKAAAKLIHPNMLSRSDLEHEAGLLNALHNINPHLFIKAIQAYNTPVGNLILVLELLPNGRLLDFIIEHYTISYSEIVASSFVRQIVESLNYLHDFNIVHLDLKPENLMVEANAQNAVVKLIDFGDAHLMTRSNNNLEPLHCMPGKVLGSVEFTAPELIEISSSNLITKQADMWSLGCIIYVMLTGLSPFFDETTEETCKHIVQADYSFPPEHFKDVSENAKNLIQNLLVKNSMMRITSSTCLQHNWFNYFSTNTPLIGIDRLQSFVDRRSYWATDVKPLRKDIVKQIQSPLSF